MQYNLVRFFEHPSGKVFISNNLLHCDEFERPQLENYIKDMPVSVYNLRMVFMPRISYSICLFCLLKRFSLTILFPVCSHSLQRFYL